MTFSHVVVEKLLKKVLNFSSPSRLNDSVSHAANNLTIFLAAWISGNFSAIPLEV
jgi:hypothetical protein